jgi:hypothetical protein
MAAGKFQGMIAATIPTGSSRMTSCWPGAAGAASSPTFRYFWLME